MTYFSDTDPCFKCPCGKCTSISMDQHLMNLLNSLAGSLHVDHNITLRVTSGYRCAAHNAAVGGSPLSLHCAAKAVDLATDGDAVLARRIVAAAFAWQFAMVEVCPSHIHVDTRDTAQPMLICGATG